MKFTYPVKYIVGLVHADYPFKFLTCIVHNTHIAHVLGHSVCIVHKCISVLALQPLIIWIIVAIRIHNCIYTVHMFDVMYIVDLIATAIVSVHLITVAKHCWLSLYDRVRVNACDH